MVEDEIVKCKLEIEQAVETFQENFETDNALSIRDVHAEIVSIVEKYTSEKGQSTALDFLPPAVSTPKGIAQEAESLTVGELVLVRRLSKTPVTVVEIPERSEYVTVQLGSLNMQVKLNEVIKIRSAGSVSGSKSTEQVCYSVEVFQLLLFFARNVRCWY